MSGRAYEKRELKDWGYVALVCIALVLTTLTTAVAGTGPRAFRPSDAEKGEACLVKNTSQVPLAACEAKSRTVTIKELQSVLQSAFALPPGQGWNNHPDSKKYAD